jgi:hypothetical protein
MYYGFLIEDVHVVFVEEQSVFSFTSGSPPMPALSFRHRGSRGRETHPLHVESSIQIAQGRFPDTSSRNLRYRSLSGILRVLRNFPRQAATACDVSTSEKADISLLNLDRWVRLTVGLFVLNLCAELVGTQSKHGSLLLKNNGSRPRQIDPLNFRGRGRKSYLDSVSATHHRHPQWATYLG